MSVLPLPLRSSRSPVLLAGSLLSLVLLATIALSLAQGSIPLSVATVWQALWHQGDALSQTIVWELRLPRILAGVLVGAAMGMSGALLQGLLRNGLADASVLGISAGAGLVATVLFYFGGLQSWIPIAAWGGALVAATIVYLLGFTATGVAIERLILAGIAVNSLLAALQTMLLLLMEEGRVQTVLNWLIGSLNGRGWAEVRLASPYILVALVLGCLLARSLNLLNLGDDLAVSLGASLIRDRLLIGAIASLLAASAVSICGLVGFVGLVVPHGVRLLVGQDYRWLLPLSAIAGAWVMAVADLLARSGAIEFPVGAITALIGSPMFIWLLYRGKPGVAR